LLQPLPFAQPDRLVQLNETFKPSGVGTVSYPTLQDWRSDSTVFHALIAYQNTSKNLQGVAEPERVATVAADRDLFRLLGVEPIAGRTFRADDPPNVVVVGATFWKRRYASNPSLIGDKINLDGESFTVIGVMPETFQFPYRASYTELWTPMEVPPSQANARGNHYLFVVARLKPGVSVDAARTELGVIAKRLEAEYPGTNEGRGVRVTPLAEVVVGRVRESLLVLLGAVGLVLLVACANVANLLLARAAGRAREVSIRAALGASRARLIRQFLTESVLLAIAGGLLGLLVAQAGTSLLIKLAAGQIPRYWEIGLDTRVFLFLLAVCVITGIGFGLAPALAAARSDVQAGLREGSGRASSGRAAGRLRDALVVAEVALAFVLLMGAGLLLRSFLYLESRPIGVVTENVLTMRMSISETEYGAKGAAGRYFQAMEDRIRAIPGVRAAGFIQLLPLQDWGWNGNFTVDGHLQESSSRQPLAELRYVTPGYFQTLGVPLLKGRGFDSRDAPDSMRVTLVNDTVARRYFPNEDPIGKHTNRGTIVGVVGDVRQVGLDQPPAAEFYFPLAQSPVYGVSLVVSGQMPATAMAGAVREAIRQVNPNQALFNVKPMDRVVADSLSNLNLYFSLLGLFAGLALLLAVAGIYGVISYTVTARTREFGIRLALGASSRRVLGLVVGRGAILVGLGLVLGAASALALTRLLKALLAGVGSSDLLTLIVVAAALAVTAMAACVIPARRAMSVDPVLALRQE
jgi:predicted permease